MKTLTLALVVVFAILRLEAQVEFRPGIIIPKEYDSITGTIEYLNDMNNAIKFSFKTISGVTTSYSPFEIYGYRFTGGKLSRGRTYNII